LAFTESGNSVKDKVDIEMQRVDGLVLKYAREGAKGQDYHPIRTVPNQCSTQSEQYHMISFSVEMKYTDITSSTTTTIIITSSPQP
jgi:hypothetical protein